MEKYLLAGVLIQALIIQGCSTVPKISVPKAKKETKILEKFGDRRKDEYFWMRQRDTPKVLAHLEAENKYAEAYIEPFKNLQDKIFEEMKGRIKKDDSSVPYEKNGYYYYLRFEKGNEYPFFCSKKGSLKAKEQILLNVNELARGQKYFQVTSIKVSPDRRILSYAVDTVGRRKYELRFKDLKTGKALEVKVPDVTQSYVWGHDSRYLFYVKQHPTTLRWDSVYRLNLKTQKSKRIYFEKDEKFYVNVSKSRSEEYILIGAGSTMTSEWRYFRANRPLSAPKVFAKRKFKVEYSVEHGGDRFFVLTNWNAENFRLMETPERMTSMNRWKEVIPHRKDTLLENVMAFKSKLALFQRKNGLRQIALMDRSTGGITPLDAPDPSYVMGGAMNPNFDTNTLRYTYESMNRPTSVLDFNWKTGKTKLMKEEEVLGGFKKENYISERVYAKAKDGVEIPISLVYKKGFKKDGKSPVVLYGYGSYGHTIEPYFSSQRLSLLDRGFAFAIAHIRGSSTMGRAWYENGKLEHKKNTFSDFVAASEHLIEKKYAAKDKLYAIGGSAGGLLMGAVVNMSPHLYGGVIAAVPFVDVLTTMLDDSLPLTVNEYEEWGNPNEKKYYNYIKSYSPYDNVAKQDYPPILVTTGYHDSQVQYWEPAKWVAKLRDYTTSDHPIIFKTEMSAGHSGVTGRFKRLKDTALNYAFFVHLAGR